LFFNFDKNGIDPGESVRVEFAADGVNFTTLSTITNDLATNADGNAAGTRSLALPGTYTANSVIRFVGSAINGAGEDIRIDNVRIDYSTATAPVTGTANGEILVGNASGSIFNALGGNDRIIAGGGDDTVLAGGGDDLIGWAVGDGRDFIDGGANPAGGVGDRLIIDGDGSVETYVVYTRADAITAGIAVLNATTEIVITRNGTVITELANVEEITINTRGGADLVSASGNFDPTRLAYNTITVTGGADDAIDASRLTSAHHLVLNVDPALAQQAAASEPFAGVGQSLMNTLARNGLLNVDERADLEFVGSRLNGMFNASLVPTDQGIGLHFNPMFEREPAIDFAASDFGQAQKSLHQALHFDAADHLIS
jgi:hypothetical protein